MNNIGYCSFSIVNINELQYWTAVKIQARVLSNI